MANEYMKLAMRKVSDIMYLIAHDHFVQYSDDDNFKDYLSTSKILYEIPEEIKPLLDYIFWYNADRDYWNETYYNPKRKAIK